jgi:hypothetical protein
VVLATGDGSGTKADGGASLASLASGASHYQAALCQLAAGGLKHASSAGGSGAPPLLLRATLRCRLVGLLLLLGLGALATVANSSPLWAGGSGVAGAGAAHVLRKSLG